MSALAPISDDDYRELVRQYSNFFRVAMNGRPIPKRRGAELLEFADACDRAAQNLKKDEPRMAAALVKFAKNCREVANRTSGE